MANSIKLEVLSLFTCFLIVNSGPFSWQMPDSVQMGQASHNFQFLETNHPCFQMSRDLRSKIHTINFPRPFSIVPRVAIGMKMTDSWDAQPIDIQISPYEVTGTYFTYMISCITGWQHFSVAVNWIATDNPLIQILTVGRDFTNFSVGLYDGGWGSESNVYFPLTGHTSTPKAIVFINGMRLVRVSNSYNFVAEITSIDINGLNVRFRVDDYSQLRILLVNIISWDDRVHADYGSVGPNFGGCPLHNSLPVLYYTTHFATNNTYIDVFYAWQGIKINGDVPAMVSYYSSFTGTSYLFTTSNLSDNMGTCYVQITWVTFKEKSCPVNEYLHLDWNCLATCPDGFTPNGKICTACHSTCLTCSGLTSETCTSCGVTRHLIAGNICDLCSPFFLNCEECTQLKCTKCQPAWFLNSNSQCTQTCQTGQYGEITSRTCEICGYPCSSCKMDDKNFCYTCSDIRITPPGCVCPDTYFSVPDVAQCSSCYYQCEKCTSYAESASSCLNQNCIGNRVDNIDCDCPDGTYQPNFRSTNCPNCHSSCQTCNGPSSQHCKTCPTNWYKLGNGCTPSCPNIGFYEDDDLFICQPCEPSCLSCDKGGPNDCKECGSSRFLLGKTCLTSCPVDIAGVPDKYFSNMIQRSCTPCVENCQICNNPTTCIECVNSTHQYLQQGLCVQNCQTDYYIDVAHRECLRCHPNCKTCNQKFEYNCQSCYPGAFLLKDSECVPRCPAKFFQDVTLLQCIPCSKNCDYCSTNTFCTQCQKGYYIWLDPDNDTSVQECYLECPRGSIKMYSTRKCYACKFANQIWFNNRCISGSCPTYYFLDKNFNDCVICFDSCFECSGPSSLQCQSCQKDYFMQEAPGIKQCVTRCSDGFFNDVTIGQCSACTTNCLHCDRTGCLGCQQSYFMLKNLTCDDQCPIGTYGSLEQRLCETCHPTCQVCMSGQRTDCLSCVDGLFLLGSTCISPCPNGYYKDQSLKICSKCDKSCLICSGPGISECDKCYSPLVIEGGQCVESCSNTRTYLSPELGKCDSCNSDCLTCSGPGVQDCLSCDPVKMRPLLVNKSYCTDTCPPGQTPSADGKNCQQCHFSCLTCTGASSSDCSFCSKDFFLLTDVSGNQSCVSDCPKTKEQNFITQVCDPVSSCLQKFFMKNGACQSCHSSCRRCSESTEFDCLACFSPLALDITKGTCVENCPENYFQNTVTSVCNKCSIKCKNCADSANNCTECGNSDRILADNCECKIGTMVDAIDGSCPICNYPCSKCSVFPYNCISCAENRLNILPNCFCPPGFWDNGLALCAKCSFKCLTCFSQEDQCITCLGDRTGDSCTCPISTFDDGVSISCIPCAFKCGSCETAQDNCLTCLGDRLLDRQCACADGFYDDGVQFNCSKCSFHCLTCSDNQKKCGSCRGDRIDPPLCRCPDGFYDDGISDTCLKCDYLCSKCDLLGCTECALNRVGPFNTKCICPIQERGISRIELETGQCTTCKLAVLGAQFSINLSEIIINAGAALLFQDDESAPIDNTSDFCNMVLKSQFIAQIGGTQAICQMKLGNFVIKLGLISTVIEDDIVEFQNGVQFQLSGCQESDGSQIFIKEYRPAKIKLPAQNLIEPPQIKLSSIPSDISLCRNFQVEIIDFAKTGARFPLGIEWQLNSSQPPNSDIDSQFKNLLNDLNKNEGQILQIPFLFLAPFTTYQIVVKFKNFAGIEGLQSFTIITSSTKSIEISMDGSIDKSFFTRNTIYNNAIIDHLSCASGFIENIPVEISVSFTYLSGSKEINTKIDATQIQQSNELSVDWEIAPFTFPPDSIHYFKVVATDINNSALKREIKWSNNILVSKLLTIIRGGNRNAGFASLVRITGKSYDPDISPDQEKLPENQVNLSWTCFNVNNNEECKDTEGQLIQLSTNDTFIIPPQSLEPYQAYIIMLTGSQNNGNPLKNTFSKITLIITELDLPALQVDVPQFILTKRVNLNQEIALTLQYPDANPDSLFYSGAFLYNMEVVAIMVFDYLKFNFRIWDHFQQFGLDQPTISLRCSIYNPQFIMPSQTSIILEINIPPMNCHFSFVQEQKDQKDIQIAALETIIRFQVSDCVDSDSPLLYRFSFYINETMMMKDINGSLNGLNLNYLSDFSSDEYYDTLLVPSNINNETQLPMPLIIMATVMDGAGGITNLTKPLNVSEVPSAILSDTQGLYEKIDKLKDNQLTEAGLLCIYSDALLNFQTPEFLEIDQLLIERLSFHLDQNPSLVWKEQITKSIGMLNNKQDLIQEKRQNSTAFEDVQNRMDLFLESQIQNYNKQTKNNTLIENGDIEAQQVSDNLSNNLLKSLESFSSLLQSNVLNISALNITNSPNQTSPTNLQNTTSSANTSYNQQIKAQNDKNVQILNSVKFIDSLLQLNALPNSPAKEFNTQSLKISSQILTTKNLLKLLSPTDSLQLIGSDDTDLSDNSNTTQKSDDQQQLQFGIHQMGLKIFQINPYITEPEFPYRSSEFQVFNLSLHEQILNSTQSRLFRILGQTTDLSQDSQTNNKYPPGNFYFEKKSVEEDVINPNSTSSVQLACIQKDSMNKSWTNTTCSQNDVKDSHGTKIGTSCQCNQIDAVTVVKDLENLFSNSKLNQAFSADATAALANFEFWFQPLFYCICAITFIYILQIPVMISLDQRDRKIFPENSEEQNKGAVQSDENEQNPVLVQDKQQVEQKPLTPYLQQQDQNDQDPIPNTPKLQPTLQRRRRSRVKREQNDIDEEIQEIFSSLDKYNIDYKHSNEKDDEQLNQKQGSQEQDNQISIYSPKESDEQGQEILTQPLTIEESSVGQVKFTWSNFVKMLKLEHTFLSIFYCYDSQESRVRRLTMEFIKMIVYLTILLGFTKANIVQTILLCILSSIVVKICVAITAGMISSQQISIQYIGALMTFAISGLSIYLILVFLAVSELEDLRQTFFKYVSQIINDYCIIDVIKCALQLTSLVYKLNNPSADSMISKILNLFYTLALHLKYQKFN